MKYLKELAGMVLIAAVVYFGYQWYKAPIFSNGYEAPDFTGYKINGDSLKLSDFKGQLVLLDFWGSWCGPCRQENPSLVKLYNAYHGKTFKKESDFTIISIGIETSKESWLAAIRRDGLIWPNHVSEIKRFRDKITAQYGVKEIPTKYLIDGEGVIIGVNLSYTQLDKLLSSRISS